jgi:hypothetical protein
MAAFLRSIKLTKGDTRFFLDLNARGNSFDYVSTHGNYNGMADINEARKITDDANGILKALIPEGETLNTFEDVGAVLELVAEQLPYAPEILHDYPEIALEAEKDTEAL